LPSFSIPDQILNGKTPGNFRLVVASVMALPVRSCLIDGEVIVSDEAGLGRGCAGCRSRPASNGLPNRPKMER
jgi:hypothetical protein